MKRAYGYLRASTDRQDASVPAQREAVENLARTEGFEVVGWFQDDGVSGKSFDRPDYLRMRALIVGGNPDQVSHIAVWSLSRFARTDPDDFVAERRDLRRAGVTIVSATESIAGGGTLADGLISYVSAYQNYEFIVKLSTDVRRGMKSLVERGFWPSMAPMGFSRLVVDNDRHPIEVNGKPLVMKRGQLKGCEHHVVLIPGEQVEQDAIGFMFRKRDEGWGLRKIAVALNETGLKTLQGKPWKQTTVRSCLTNIGYIGHTRYGFRRKLDGVRNQIEGVKLRHNPTHEVLLIENTHEPLVPVGLFERVQASFHSQAERRRLLTPSGGKRLLFSSAITCQHCGAKYQSRPRLRHGKRYDYYECSGRSAGRTSKRCDGWCLNVVKLKQFIFGEIQRRVSADEFQSALRAYLIGRLGQLLRSDVLDTRQIERHINAVETKKRRLIDSIADGLLDRHDNQMVEKFAEINDELLRLSARRAEIEKVLGSNIDPDAIAAQMLQRVHNLASYLGSEDLNDQRQALFAFCGQIVADAEIKEVVIKTDLLGTAQGQTPPGLPTGLLDPRLPE